MAPRAYEDALLELNEVMEQAGFSIVASGALWPSILCLRKLKRQADEQDAAELPEFAGKVLKKLDREKKRRYRYQVLHPYKPAMKVAAAPLSLDNCILCGTVRECVPQRAIK